MRHARTPLSALLFAAAGGLAAAATPPIGSSAPDFTLSTIDGKYFPSPKPRRATRPSSSCSSRRSAPTRTPTTTGCATWPRPTRKQGVLFVGINSNKTEPLAEVVGARQGARPHVSDREGSGQQGRGPLRRQAHARGVRRGSGREARLPRPHRRELRGAGEGRRTGPEERPRSRCWRTRPSRRPRPRRSAARSRGCDAAPRDRAAEPMTRRSISAAGRGAGIAGLLLVLLGAGGGGRAGRPAPGG